ncbi:MAG: TIGR03790 family protein, partial [Bdellovibrionales bacterium]|nr:TIGR03790 family protein [Bdellovibrionales bacterium]
MYLPKKLISGLLFFASMSLLTLSSRSQADLPEASRVLVVYNDRSPDSIWVAQSYVQKRGIPLVNLCPLSGLSDSGTSATYIPWGNFDSLIRFPIQRCLSKLGADNILYIVFAYKTPYKMSSVPENQGASIDSQVADIWNEAIGATSGVNPYAAYAYSAENIYTPFESLAEYRKKPKAKRVYSVFRLDGVSPAQAISLVDRAMFAERNGLDGQGCFDQTYSAPIKGVEDTGYRSGDWDIYRASQIAQSVGFPVTYDQTNVEFGTLPALLRCENSSLYAGWYSYANYNDAFSWTNGAMGLHLDSGSAENPRGRKNWAGEALHRGITFTSGSVSEPYLGNLVHPDGFYMNVIKEGA